MALADPTGAELQPLVRPNPVLGPDERIALSLIEPVDGFAEELDAIDREGVISVLPADADPVETGGIVLFAPDWIAAAYVAETVGAADLAGRMLSNRGTGIRIDISTVDMGGPEPLHFYTIIPGAGGLNIPAECYARLIGSVIYAGGQPQVFELPACMESLR